MSPQELADSLIVERYTNNGPMRDWTPDEQAMHRQQLMDATRTPMNVKRRVAGAPCELDVDWVAVERTCAGQYEPLTRTERVEAVRYMRGHRVPYRVMQERLRVSGTVMAQMMRETD